MRGEENSSERRAQGRVEAQGRDVPGPDPAAHDRGAALRCALPAVPSLREALTAALRQRVLQRAVRGQGAHTPLVGHICEHCFDAPALLVQPAHWGGEMGVRGACQQERPAGHEAPQAD